MVSVEAQLVAVDGHELLHGDRVLSELGALGLASVRVVDLVGLVDVVRDRVVAALLEWVRVELADAALVAPAENAPVRAKRESNKIRQGFR